MTQRTRRTRRTQKTDSVCVLCAVFPSRRPANWPTQSQEKTLAVLFVDRLVVRSNPLDASSQNLRRTTTSRSKITHTAPRIAGWKSTDRERQSGRDIRRNCARDAICCTSKSDFIAVALDTRVGAQDTG